MPNNAVVSALKYNATRHDFSVHLIDHFRDCDLETMQN